MKRPQPGADANGRTVVNDGVELGADGGSPARGQHSAPPSLEGDASTSLRPGVAHTASVALPDGKPVALPSGPAPRPMEIEPPEAPFTFTASMPGRLLALTYGRERLCLVLLCLALWLPGFFALPPGDRDESRFAQASKQMNETGDYVRIMNGTTPRLRKPIGIYWLQAPAAALAGPGLANPIWPYRIPSLLGGLAAVLATFQAGLLLTPGRRSAVAAGAMLAGCVILTVETHVAKTDAALLGLTTVAMAVLARAWLARRVAALQAAAFWLAMGAGILVKGPITPMVAGLAALTLCVWGRRARWLVALRPGWGVPLMLAVTAPWFVAISRATHGAFFAQSVGGDLGGKLAGGSETHGGLPGLHLLLLPLLAFPATLPVLAALPAAWRGRRDEATRFLIAWALPAWLVFEAVPTKLPHYTLPLYPALFLLAAKWLGASGPAGGGSGRSVQTGRAALGVAACRSGRSVVIGRAALAAAACALAGAALALPPLLGGSWWLGLPACACVALVATLAWRGRLAWALLGCIPLYAAILQVELPGLAPLWIAPRVEAALRRDWPGWNPSGDRLAVAGYAEPSLVFLAGTHTQLLPNGRSAADALHAGTAGLVLVTDKEAAGFTREAQRLGMATRTLETVRGFNYSRGRWVSLGLLVR